MKIGIAGAGSIIPEFLKAQKLIGELEVKAICATGKSKDRLEKFALEYGIADIYYDYYEMLGDEELDVIYIAVPNFLHYSFTKYALECGKSVICEKPFCSNYKEAEDLVHLAQEGNQYLFEAITNQYFPNYEKVRELRPTLGNLKIVELNYSQYSSRYDSFKQRIILPVFDPKQSGGALMDLNVYQIHFVIGLFGEPEEVQYLANIQQGIDTSGVLLLKYSDFVCTCIAAKDCKAPACINIQGDEGYIHSDSPSNAFDSFLLVQNDGSTEKYYAEEAV